MPSIAEITDVGGAEPPVAMSTTCSNFCFRCAGAWIKLESTIGAPHMCVTPFATIDGKISAGSTRLRHTCVAPAAVTAHVNVQPLQWNIGRVQRYTDRDVTPNVSALPS